MRGRRPFWGRGVWMQLLEGANRVVSAECLTEPCERDVPGANGRFADARQLRRDNGELAALYAAADVFVFPSRTDTFGLVLLEALASGVPIAAYPVPGPLDIVGDSGVGALDEDLRAAALAALAIPHERCRAHALNFTWRNSARQFLANLRPTTISASTE